jgi:hypothetical protein
MTVEVCDPTTGELVTASHLAVIYANAREERAEQAAELRKLDAEIADLYDALKEAAASGPIDAGAGRKLVLSPPKRPAQRVSAQGAAKYREILQDLGLGREESVYRPPSITEVRNQRALLLARGVDLDELAPEPIPGPATLEVVHV